MKSNFADFLKRLFGSKSSVSNPVDSTVIEDAFLEVLNKRELTEQLILEVETHLNKEELFEVIVRRESLSLPLAEESKSFFEKYDEVIAQLYSLRLAFLGHPEWLPSDIGENLFVVGWTIGQEYLFIEDHSNKIYQIDLEWDPQEVKREFSSVYHLLLFILQYPGSNAEKRIPQNVEGEWR